MNSEIPARPFLLGKLPVNRRTFLKTSAFVTAGVTLARLPVMAGPFTREDFEKLVPADKKLRPEWVRSLTARGARTVYHGAELKLIGMPVGGITCGQLYLGGDGKLWHWDIFNQQTKTGPEHYAKPVSPSSPIEQGFALRLTQGGKTQVRPLNRTGWNDISFIGEYPIGFVEYRDTGVPVAVSLEAFSPFTPLKVDDSSLPATVMRFTVKNTGAEKVEAELGGWLENAVCLQSGRTRDLMRQNRIVTRGQTVSLECSAGLFSEAQSASARADISFDDFERENYEGWAAEGTAFGSGPVEQSRVPVYQGDLAMHGKRAVNSHASAPGDNVGVRDDATGKLTSKPFSIDRNFIHFLIGGGAQKEKTCVNLLVEGKVVRSATGNQANRLQPVSWDVRPWSGKTAQLQIVDAAEGTWGNIGADDFVFSDRPRSSAVPLENESDFGTMSLVLLAEQRQVRAAAQIPSILETDDAFAPLRAENFPPASRSANAKLMGALACKLPLAPGESATVTFVLTWHFPNLTISGLGEVGRHYKTRFGSASLVARYVTENFRRLYRDTRLWHDVWYDSTLPYWFLDRTLLNISVLATSTAYRFASGRFYGCEGVGCCEGTCTHVWQYEQAMGRLFPELDILLREHADFNPAVSFKPDGMIDHRGEFHAGQAVDGQAGTILRAYRDHQVSPDNAFLKRNYVAIKKAMQWLIQQDGNGDGILEGAQHNTLDAAWYGPVAWLSGLYLASVRAAEEMAKDMGDDGFAAECRAIAEAGRKNMAARLFNGEYFINLPDPKHPEAINSGSGCEIDQVFGQSWAFQVGLGRVLRRNETRSALKSLWRYNFSPDVGPYREVNKPGRWYAMAGEAGLLMCTFPKADWDYEKAKGKGPEWAAGYFNECMNGFEHQVAGHMIWEGMLTEGLAVERAVHDRYHAARRNPWNEIECGDHYARSMASYGVFLAACGFEYHGPRGYLGFAPRLMPENFKAPFTTAEGWGTFSQKAEGSGMNAEIVLKFGRLRLKTFALGSLAGAAGRRAEVTHAGDTVQVSLTKSNDRAMVTFADDILLTAGQTLAIKLT